jgi:hypothetical protein
LDKENQKMRRRVGTYFFLLVFLFAVGCGGGGPTVVPVSGTVYLDGKPKAGLHVMFQPLGSKDNPNPGRGSHGITDTNGKFTLTYDGTKPGAVVARHKVAICTVLAGEGKNVDPETGSPDGTPVKGGQEIIPTKYNDQTTLTFDVEPGGTDKADFKLSSK